MLIVESTYGTQCHGSREEREGRFTGTVDEIVRRGGETKPSSLLLDSILFYSILIALLYSLYSTSHCSLQGKCLIPVFALGRAQELLLILDEHWRLTPSIQNVPVFYASQLATKVKSYAGILIT